MKKILWILAWLIIVALLYVWINKNVDSDNDFSTQSAFVCDENSVWITLKECQALVDFYNATNWDNWTNNDNRLDPNIPLSEWRGIKKYDTIYSLNLVNNNLTWEIPESIWNLTNLKYLNLTSNNLTWNIPSSLWNLLKLEDLKLSNNDLTWEIPDSFWNLINLKILRMTFNQLTWEIPDSFWNLSNLVVLYLVQNKLTWELPSSLWNLTNLSSLRLANNQFSWSIPDVFENLWQVKTIVFYGNKFTWSIPISLWNLSNLETLNLAWNQLCWNVPLVFSESWKRNSSNFIIGNNKLNNKSSDYSPQMRERVTDNLSMSLSVQEPNWCNYLGEIVEKEIVEKEDLQFDCAKTEWISVKECNALVDFYYSTNWDNWTNNSGRLVPNAPFNEWRWVMVRDWSVIDLSVQNNNLTWELPESLWDLSKLEAISLYWNDIWWELPESLWDLSELSHINIVNNKITWELPKSIWKLVKLKKLLIYKNKLIWELPDSIWNLIELNSLGLATNQFTWKIPNSIWNLLKLNVLDLAGNNFIWEIPSSLWNLTNLHWLMLWSNDLSWKLPSSLWNLNKVVKLDLSNNNFTWEILTSFAKLWKISEDWNVLEKEVVIRLYWNSFCWDLSEEFMNAWDRNKSNFQIQNNNLSYQPSDYEWEMWSRLNDTDILWYQTPNKCNDSKKEKKEEIYIVDLYPDPDGISWAEIWQTSEWKLSYCQKFYPDTVSQELVVEWYKSEWRCTRNHLDCSYASSKPLYACVGATWDNIWYVSFWQGKVNMHSKLMWEKKVQDKKVEENKAEKKIEEKVQEKKTEETSTQEREITTSRTTWSWWSRTKDIMYCGNWKLELDNDEECDDGNYISWDWCNNYCKSEGGIQEIQDYQDIDTQEVIIGSQYEVIDQARSDFDMLQHIHALKMSDVSEDTQNFTKYILFRVSQMPKDDQKVIVQKLVDKLSELKNMPNKYNGVSFDAIVYELDKVIDLL